MPELPSLVIVGAGGLGRGVAALVEALNSPSPSWNLTGFVDDDASLRDQSVMGYPVHGGVEWLSQRENLFFSIAIGDGDARQQIAGQLSQSLIQPACLLHPSTSPHRTSEIKSGTIARKGVATAVDCRIGPHTVVNMNCTIGHDSTLEAFVTLHPGVHISGSVHLGTGVTVGSGSVVLPNTRIGSQATIGAGAVVTEDLPPDCTAVGRPAHPQ
ncbi:acetyltransferase [Salinibacter ruber]|uniref:acetyltransferase n=1 Tax=Salinibacter ruber TaxID=146919 RepID=UPI0021688BB3